MSLLKIRGLKKEYDRRLILNIDEFEIFEGLIYSLLGINGAGKSSFTSILSSLHPPTKGEILWREKSLFDQITAYRKFMGYCPQEQTLDANLNLRQILQFQGRLYGLSKAEVAVTANHLLQQFELEPYAESFPCVLSGGFKQRFLIAKSLMHHPRFLILDEPTVGLDALARETFWNQLLKLKEQGITILFTTHYLSEAEKYSDRVCILHQGTLQANESPLQIKARWQKPDLESAFLELLAGEHR